MSRSDSLALYVHWPWCLAKCPYCDFNSRPLDPGETDQADFRTAILHELDHYASQTDGFLLGSIFFGGGTPSLIAPETIYDILESAEDRWGLDMGCEITLEANPTSIEAAKFRAFHDAGVNRVSVGVQALNDDALQALGREHSVREALQALEVARAIFDRFTFDLIYARPGQGQGDWADELEQALELAGDHISLYQLTVEPGTPFFRQQVSEAPEDLAVDMFEMTQEMCADAGLPAYEVSNHARPGQESRHNMVYWTGGDYIGIGPGAHGRLTNGTCTRASHQIADPARWLEVVNTQGHGTAKVRELSKIERVEELILSGLRLSEGINTQRFQQLSGQELMSVLNRSVVNDLMDADLLEHDSTGLRVTRSGRLMLNAIISRLLDEPATNPELMT